MGTIAGVQRRLAWIHGRQLVDAERQYRMVLAEGGLQECRYGMAKRPFVGNGLWVVSVTDPDGYRIDFESPTTEPEESEYTPTS